MTFPVLRFIAGVMSGAAGLTLVIVGALRGDLALITPGIAILGPLMGFFVGDANGRRASGTA